jgi:hypothetical protein
LTEESAHVDTTPISTELARLITLGTTEHELLLMGRKFPELTSGELSAALQGATAAAEKQAARRH